LRDHGYPWDLRNKGRCSDVKVTRSDGSVYYQKAGLFEEVTLREKNFQRLASDLKYWKAQQNN